ncbi:sensor domain-containing diguanylate cyclase [Dongshaea marina]|uniref:sensor domain-containing diguanylate cyclase n=1 Tax=Dongshaea marina TaxID=2047966 RepID=UPI000D3E7B6D|nr:diguanylate cyclase [Dongshaea marina]
MDESKLAQRATSNISESEKVIRTLYQITSNHSRGFPYQVQQLLQLGCDRFDLEIGILSRCSQNSYQVKHCLCPRDIPITQGQEFEIDKTYCEVTLKARQPVWFEHVGESELKSHPAYQGLGLESYIGIPVILENNTYGTLNFSSPVPRQRKFSPTDIDALKLMASWLSSELERQQREIKLRVANEELRRANLKLKEQSTTDELTQVGNRRLLNQKLDTYMLLAQRGMRPLSAVIIDLDDFKKLNDTYGHPSGDEALITLAYNLVQTARRGDLIARYGGEEFVVILPDTDEQGAMRSAERYRLSIEQTDSLVCPVTASLGIATYRPQEGDLDPQYASDRLLCEADEALYHSKHTGKNRCSHYHKIGT